MKKFLCLFIAAGLLTACFNDIMEQQVPSKKQTMNYNNNIKKEMKEKLSVENYDLLNMFLKHDNSSSLTIKQAIKKQKEINKKKQSFKIEKEIKINETTKENKNVESKPITNLIKLAKENNE